MGIVGFNCQLVAKTPNERIQSLCKSKSMKHFGREQKLAFKNRHQKRPQVGTSSIMRRAATTRQIRSLVSVVTCTSLLLVLSSDYGSSFQRSPKQLVNCSRITDVLDRCGALASYSHTIPGSEYPTSIEELREACPRHNEGLHCLRQHVRCLKPLTKRAILSFIESRRKHVKKLCSNVSGQAARDFTEAFACIKKHKRNKFVESEVMAIKRIDAILSEQVTDFKERFQRSCCSINHYRQRTIEDMGPECAKPQLVSAVESAIDSVTGEAIEFACDVKASVCQAMRPLVLSEERINKTLTRSGTELMIVLTAPEDPQQIAAAATGASASKPKRAR